MKFLIFRNRYSSWNYTSNKIFFIFVRKTRSVVPAHVLIKEHKDSQEKHPIFMDDHSIKKCHENSFRTAGVTSWALSTGQTLPQKRLFVHHSVTKTCLPFFFWINIVCILCSVASAQRVLCTLYSVHSR
jgi:hypothetical protein